MIDKTTKKQRLNNRQLDNKLAKLEAKAWKVIKFLLIVLAVALFLTAINIVINS